MEVQRLSRFLSAILLFSVIGCTAVPIEEPVISSAPLVDQLKTLTPPVQKVPIAVYQFGDLTGQRKPSETLASLSTAVTQGAHVMLIQALKKAGNGEWFQVVERVGLDNLLKERQIIRNTRDQFEGKDAKKLKALLFAGVLLEGGVIGYDTNIETGGAGARYLGIGIHDEYRRDVVSVGIRLISVQTGEVLLAISTHKTIMSTKVGVNVFRFLDMGTKLLETEIGFTQNESITYAVRKAIEASVVEMVEKGEERHTYQIVTKREITFSYMIRAKNEEDAMIRTLSFVSKDGSGQREDVKRPMYNSKPMIREWIEKIVKLS